MQTLGKVLSRRSLGAAQVFQASQYGARDFAVTKNEIKKLEAEFRRKFNAIKMYAEDTEFTYERPRMLYDKKTGDVQILAKEE